LLITEQSERLQKLKEIVWGTEQFRQAQAEGKTAAATDPETVARWCFATPGSAGALCDRDQPKS